MSADPISLTPAELRAFRRRLADVSDGQLLQVVALVDRMVERGGVDDVIAPLRVRFGRVRPSRPLRFTRLMFLPLDPVLVPAPRYRAGMAAVPRSAAIPLAGIVHAALGVDAVPVEALIAGHSVTDLEVVQAAGERVWPKAARILRNATQPAGWAATGIPATLFGPLAHAVAAVLDQASALQAAVLDGAAGLPVEAEAIDAFLTRAATAGPQAWSLVLAVLVARLPTPSAVWQQATRWAVRRNEPLFAAAIEQALDSQFALLEGRDTAIDDLITADLVTASAEVCRIAGLLDAFAGETSPIGRRVRADAIRRRLDESCRVRFANGLAEELLAPLQALLKTRAPSAPPQLEVAARRLRALETEARRLGSAATYDALLHQTAAAVQNLARDAGLMLADTVRLVEILVGPEAALLLLA